MVGLVCAERSSRGVAFTIFLSKTFDTVWHKGLLAKLRALGVTGDEFACLASLLKNKKQRVHLASQARKCFSRCCPGLGVWSPSSFSAVPSINRTLFYALLNAISSLTIQPSCQQRNDRIRTTPSLYSNLLLPSLVSGFKNGVLMLTVRRLRPMCYDRTV